MRRAILALLACLVSPPALACGVETDCTLGDRTYRIELPAEVTPQTGALIFMHGYRGSANGTMRNQALRAFAAGQGLALVAANADMDDWQIPGVPNDPGNDGSREDAYFTALIGALAQRHGLNTDRLIATGFSAGGMVTWQLACRFGQRIDAYIPIAGTFWDPVPEACPGFPVDLVHVHGTSDRIVPLIGRPIASTRQGDVATALDLLGASADFEAAVREVTEGELTCTAGTSPQGGVLASCLHPGGHSFKIAYLETALRLLAAER